MSITSLGWNPCWQAYLQSHGIERLVRIVARHKTLWEAIAADGRRLHCYLPGKLQHRQIDAAERPVVGDWCLIAEVFADETGADAAMISEVLPRYSKISRLAAGREAEEQVLAANVDYCFVVTSANREFNAARLRRYLLVAQQGKAEAVILLSKVDVAENLAGIEQCLQSDFAHVPRVRMSIPLNRGVDEVREYLQPGRTGVFVGSSGVGKSTLVNILLQQAVQKTGEIRAEDDKGRHTTSTASLLFIPDGGMIIDTPGLREIQVFGDDEELEETFENITRFAAGCRFRDCTHTSEPGCAVLDALQRRQLGQNEYDSYLKLQKELAHANRQTDQRAVAKEKKRWKQATSQVRKKRKFEEGP